MRNNIKRLFRIFIIALLIIVSFNLVIIMIQQMRDHSTYPDYLSLIRPLDKSIDNGESIEIDGVINFRGVGGYYTKNDQVVKKDLLYRSGHLSDLTEEGTYQIKKLGIKEIYDLRTDEEIKRKPDRIPEGIKYIHFPIYNEDDEPGGFWYAFSRHKLQEYWDNFNIHILADKKAKRYGELFGKIANSEGPILIHCSAGKDRVGIAVSLFLLMLGVSEEVVISDYTKSNIYFPQILNHAQIRYDEHKLFTSLLNMQAIDLQDFYLARASTLKNVVDYLSLKYGSIDTYLIEKAGLDSSTLEILRRRFLEFEESNISMEKFSGLHSSLTITSTRQQKTPLVPRSASCCR